MVECYPVDENHNEFFQHIRLSGVGSLFLQQILDVDEERIRGGVNLSSFLRHLVNNSSIHLSYTIHLQTNSIVNGVCEMNNYHIQLSSSRGNENGDFDCFELIIADNSDEDGNKRMAVLTAESLESELVEMDCSGMREDVIIDLNFGGCRWEGDRKSVV